MYMRKPPIPGKNYPTCLVRTVPDTHTGPGIVPAPATSQPGKSNSQDIGESTQKGLALVVGIN